MTLETPDLEQLLDLLEFRAVDAADFGAGLERLTPEDLQMIEADYQRLAANVGRVERRWNPVEGAEVAHPVGTEFPLLVALVRVAPLVQAELVRRGVAEDVAWHSVADLGQQVHIHRLVHGRFGFADRGWVARNYSGSHLWLGRLQFTLEPDMQALGVHIPESGPLAPEAIDESLELARRIAVQAWPEVNLQRFTCVSWLLDRELVARLDPASNMARFAARFTPFGEPTDGTRDALYFGFHRETRSGQKVDLDRLPQSSSLQRVVVERIRSRGITVQPGWFPLNPA